MKSEPLYFTQLFLILRQDLPPGIQDEEIIYKTLGMEPEYCTPGTAFYTCEKKESPSGYYYAHEFTYSFPGLVLSSDAARINKTGAVVGVTGSGRKIVLHRNDYFANSQLAIILSPGLDKTSVKFSVNSLDFL